jgi:hypothetical protein
VDPNVLDRFLSIQAASGIVDAYVEVGNTSARCDVDGHAGRLDIDTTDIVSVHGLKTDRHVRHRGSADGLRECGCDPVLVAIVVTAIDGLSDVERGRGSGCDPCLDLQLLGDRFRLLGNLDPVLLAGVALDVGEGGTSVVVRGELLELLLDSPPALQRELCSRVFANDCAAILVASRTISENIAMATKGRSKPIFEFLPTYLAADFDEISPVDLDDQTFRVLFAGRVTREK